MIGDDIFIFFSFDDFGNIDKKCRQGCLGSSVTTPHPQRQRFFFDDDVPFGDGISSMTASIFFFTEGTATTPPHRRCLLNYGVSILSKRARRRLLLDDNVPFWWRRLLNDIIFCWRRWLFPPFVGRLWLWNLYWPLLCEVKYIFKRGYGDDASSAVTYEYEICIDLSSVKSNIFLNEGTATTPPQRWPMNMEFILTSPLWSQIYF